MLSVAPTPSCGARVRAARPCRLQVVTAVEPLSGGRLLALGDEGGGLSMADLRMLGASNQGAYCGRRSSE